eukprot:3245765-Rhodomonas_salina.1
MAEFSRKHPALPPGAQTLSGREVPEGPAGAFDWLTKANIAKIAATSAPGSATDQWGWHVREFMACLLQNETIGDIWVSYILAPIAFGTRLASFNDFVIGGKLIGLRKPDEIDVAGVCTLGGIRPILIGDADWKLVVQAMMRSCSEDLAEYFLKHHPL